MKNNKYVIIGSGPAGISAIEGIRMIDKENTILLVSREEVGYSKPLITYYFADKVNINGLYYRDKEFFDNNNIEIIRNEVIDVEPDKKQVKLKANLSIKYDRLLVASGGTPFIPEIKGGHLEGVKKLNSLEDAKELKNKNYSNKNVVVLGAGMIGLKIVEAFRLKGWNVHLVELQDRILPQVLDKCASDMLLEVLKENGVNVYLENTVDEISGKGKVKRVKLKNGEIIDTALILVAIGVKPNYEFIKEAGKHGVEVNNKMETKFKGIYAAGDVIKSEDILEKNIKNIAIWPLAYRQGRVAGINMAGGNTEYSGGWLMNSMTVFDYPVITLGNSIKEEGDILKKADKDKKFYKKIIIKDNNIKGVILMKNIEGAGIYNSLMEIKADVSSFKNDLLQEDFSLISIPHKYKYREIEPLEI